MNILYLVRFDLVRIRETFALSEGGFNSSCTHTMHIEKIPIDIRTYVPRWLSLGNS